jgi:hypothetical protein
MSLRAVIPTRDSAAWIGAFLVACRECVKIEPFYVVDAKSFDDRLQILKDMSAEVVVYSTPTCGRGVTKLVSPGCLSATDI